MQTNLGHTAVSPPPSEHDSVEIARYVGGLRDGRWLIAGLSLASVTLGILYSLLATPTYRVDALLQVEEKGGAVNGLDELSAMFGAPTPAETEIEIIRSRSVLGKVVRDLALDLVVEPRRFPLAGAFMARRYAGTGPADSVWGLTSFAWGGESISVDRFDVVDAMFDEVFRLTVEGPSAFQLHDEDGQLVLSGKVGELAEANGVAILVSELTANPGARIRLVKQREAEVIRELQRDLTIAEKGKKTGILEVALEGPRPHSLETVVNAIVDNYLRQNVDRRSEEASKTLEFLNAQLPALRSQVDSAEMALNEYKSKRAVVDLTMEAQIALQQSVEIESKISELELARADLRRRFTPSHPMVASVERQLHELAAGHKTIDERLKSLPESELQFARLLRDVKVASELYTLLLNKAQELRVLKSGTIGNVRVVDYARAGHKPEWPRPGIIVPLLLILGTGLGVALALVRSGMSRGVDDPDAVERSTGLSVFASIPRADDSRASDERQNAGPKRLLLAQAAPDDLAIESIRSLRTSIKFSMLESKSNVIAVSGPSPSTGKSFVSANLAFVLAAEGTQVLLVDGDLRKGVLNKYFGVDRTPGLVEVLAGAVELDSALRKVPDTSLTFLATGMIPPNPAEMLGSERMVNLVEELRGRYDCVIIDTPPILAVSDAAAVARLAGLSLLVLRNGKHPIAEIRAAIRAFANSGVSISGTILNDVRRGGASRYHYHYSYKQEARRAGW